MLQIALALTLFAAPTQESLPYLPTPSGPLQLTMQGDAQLSMSDLLDAYERVSPVTFVVDSEVASLLNNAPWGIRSMPEISPASAPTFLQCLLRAQDFVLAPASPVELGLVRVYSLRTHQRNTIRSTAISVASSDRATMRNNPAFMMSTVVTLPNTDVRQLSNSLRSMITDANILQILPAGDTHSLVIQSFGDTMADLLHQLETVDRQNAPTDAEGSTLPTTSGERLLVRRLQFANAIELMGTLRSLYVEPAPTEGEAPTAALRWSMDSRTNTLLVRGEQAKVTAVESLIDQLDKEVK